MIDGFNILWMEPSGADELVFYYEEMDGIYTYLIYGLDSPFSLVADIVLLPLTIPLAIGKRIYYSNSKNDPSLPSHWSKYRGYGNVLKARKICEGLGMRIHTRLDLEKADA